MLQHLNVQSLVGHDLFQPAVLVFEFLEPLGFLGLHPAVLRSPAIEGRLTDLQGLQHRRLILARIEHRIRIP